MEVYLQEWFDMDIDGPLEFTEIMLHVPGTNIWIVDCGLDREQLEAMNYTSIWRKHAAEGKILLTKLGEL